MASEVDTGQGELCVLMPRGFGNPNSGYQRPSQAEVQANCSPVGNVSYP